MADKNPSEPGNEPKPRSARQREAMGVTLEQIRRLDIQPGPMMAILEAPPGDPDKVTKALQLSSALSARVLSVTNSAAIGVVGEINDIHRAVIHMGATRARSIAMAFGLNMMAQQTDLDAESAQRLWVNSLEKAHLAALVARSIDPTQAEHAYTMGLIQDLGLPALWAIDRDFYEGLAHKTGQREPLHVLEQERFGIDHTQVSNHLLKLWDASPVLCDEVLNHHQPVLIQYDASAANVGNLIAGMLPHVGEPMSPDRLEWLAAVHGQFLASSFDSPEDLIKQAVKAARETHGGAPSIRIDEATRLRMLGQIDTDTAGMVRQLCLMESQLTQKHEQVSVLQFEAMTDPLTQVLNRRGFDRLGERRLRTALERGLPVCAVMFDLDGFKQVNDTHGHEAGDRMLTAVAHMIRDNIDSSDLFGRLGGDEFVILQINVNRAVAEKIVRRVVDACVDKPVDLGEGRSAPIRFSVGAATCEKTTAKTLLGDLLGAADEAMYQSKRAGPGGISFTEHPGQKNAS